MILETYEINTDNVVSTVEIISGEGFTMEYKINIPRIGEATSAVLGKIRDQMLRESKIGLGEIFDINTITKLKVSFSQKAESMINKEIPELDLETKNILIGSLIHEMLGLGKLEVLINDDNLEEIAVNSSKEPIWVFHRTYGWLKTNLTVDNEEIIRNYASIIARRIGREVTTLNPTLDAHLLTGDRANATLFPISSGGNTITIRKFSRKAWTIVDFIQNKTLTAEVAALLWTMVQYEMNLIIAGGTSSGKTALLNTIMPFIQPNHRVVSIEDTREIQLPSFLQWVPLTTRAPNPEGKGEVSMLDLMINSLRMRPDRIVVGEIRRRSQAEVLFEAMHTGHSVYSTLHADTAEQVVYRMTNPPFNIPEVLLEALHGIVVQYRNRRKGIRMIFEIAEVIKPSSIKLDDQDASRVNVLYRLDHDDVLQPSAESKRIFKQLRLYTGMSNEDIKYDMEIKKRILDWLAQKNMNMINDVGKIIAEYYKDPQKVSSFAETNENPKRLL